MRSLQHVHPGRLAALAALVACLVLGAQAQETGSEPVVEEDEVIEEIVVRGGRRGDPIDMDDYYEELLRERIIRDLEQLRMIEEEDKWRDPDSMIVERPSRIRWGYDPEDEMRMRRDSNLQDVNFVTTRPATIFRFDF